MKRTDKKIWAMPYTEIPVMNTITREMVGAGERVASDMVDIGVCKPFGQMESWRDRNKDNPNLDLLELYAMDLLDSVSVIYLAMDRKRLVRIEQKDCGECRPDLPFSRCQNCGKEQS